jgi:hypothetical protein
MNNNTKKSESDNNSNREYYRSGFLRKTIVQEYNFDYPVYRLNDSLEFSKGKQVIKLFQNV